MAKGGRRRMLLHLLTTLVLVSATPPQAKNGVIISRPSSSLLKNTTTCDASNASAVETTSSSERRRRQETTTQSPAKKKSKPKETGGREATCLRRIKREWRDAVKLGIAYDWMQMKTLGTSTTSDNKKYAYVRIGPLGKNLLRWHFSVMGPPNSEYEGGVYHGRVLLPKTYPGSPPRIQVLTPSGRFITGEDICLSASAFHPESWTPQWTVLSLVEALRLHMLTTANEIGGKDDTPEQRRKYARASRQWRLGRVDHALMIRQGIFPYETKEEVSVKEENVIVENNGGVQVVTVKQRATQEAQVRAKRVPQNAKLPTTLIRAVVEVLTSPPRLALLFLLTVFVILNRR